MDGTIRSHHLNTLGAVLCPAGKDRNVEKSLLTVGEAARMLSIGRSKTYELMNAGDLPVVHIGRAVRIPVKALECWIEEQAERGSRRGSR